jgi:hypothetical protein
MAQLTFVTNIDAEEGLIVRARLLDRDGPRVVDREALLALLRAGVELRTLTVSSSGSQQPRNLVRLVTVGGKPYLRADEVQGLFGDDLGGLPRVPGSPSMEMQAIKTVRVERRWLDEDG